MEVKSSRIILVQRARHVRSMLIGFESKTTLSLFLSFARITGIQVREPP